MKAALCDSVSCAAQRRRVSHHKYMDAAASRIFHSLAGSIVGARAAGRMCAPAAARQMTRAPPRAQLTLCVSFCTCHCTFILWPLRLMNLAHVFMHVRHTQRVHSPYRPPAAFFSRSLIFHARVFFPWGAHVYNVSVGRKPCQALSFPHRACLTQSALEFIIKRRKA